MSVLVRPEELLAGPLPVLLDVRWALGDPHGREHYLEAHLPGAVFVDMESELADPPSAADGRHPLPSLQRLQAAARRWGIGEDDAVVVYDATGGLAAARAWWLLRWGGLTDVRLLDGGLDAWRRAGGLLEAGDVVPETGDVTLTGGGMPVLSIDEAAALTASGALLDARAGERYRGEVEPIDPRAGHVPGAVSAPTTENLAPDGTFLPADALRERFTALGVGKDAPVGVYCGSGVTAAHEVAALASVGIEAALWPGSWSQWAHDPQRPAAIGGGTREACAPALADLERTRPGLLRIGPSVRGFPPGPRHDAPELWLWDTESGSGTGLWPPYPDERPRDAVLRLTEVVQEAAIEAVHGAWPSCPDHPDSHPLEAAGAERGVVWVCRINGREIAAVGELPADPGRTTV